MNTPTLTIFANFRINNEERYQRMKDSFESFKDINAQKWVINIRGFYKKEAMAYLKYFLSDRLISYELESENGWFYDTRIMLKDINSDFVFFWIEDHINLAHNESYDEVLLEMQEHCVEHLIYSWWHDGYKAKFNLIHKEESKNLNIFNLDENNCDIIEKKLGRYFYTVSAVSITSINFFQKIISCNHPIVHRWSQNTPFDFEKRSTDKEFLPFKHAIPKNELFASIDDNHGTIGYSLMDRGLYEERLKREEMVETEKKTSDMQMTFPFVSLIIPNYNNEKYIKKCLDSVISQTYINIEVILVDDCSTDDSLRIIHEYTNIHHNIKVLQNKKNMGVSYSRDLGIKNATAKWITTLDSDDYYINVLKIEKEMELIIKHNQNNAIAYSGIVHVDNDGNELSKIMTVQNIREGYLMEEMITRNFAIPRDFIFSKELYSIVGGYDYSIPLYEDWDLKVRLSKEAKFIYSGIDGIAYRRHEAGLSSVNHVEHQKWVKFIFDKYSNELKNKYELEKILKKNFDFNTSLCVITKNNIVSDLVKKIKEANINSFSIFGIGELTDLLLIELSLRGINKKVNFIIDSRAKSTVLYCHSRKVVAPDTALKEGEHNFVLASWNNLDEVERSLEANVKILKLENLFIIKSNKY